ncbi:Sorbin and SH3 domain-containing protein 2 [Hondaea fermentalgiana]|uniref:Sorbin and SH3 domain-containing protein 2 n=1 Tax=Hondaea fermentalgiana TaxID=2315210 RepID=A0A2R5GHG9_9STRA|nr:Sorbin and SH3 domain-containing protein 2 [Hondaea fermentalgiana]|eukprot:GBG27324.1 Sorbin and SH3 domain-containing protein 2 [Hondaea fermentalgiana]
MAHVIKPVRARVAEDCLALGVPGSQEPRQRVRKGSLVRLTHEYKTAYYGRLEQDGSPVWLEKDVLSFHKKASKGGGDQEEEEKDQEEEAKHGTLDPGVAEEKHKGAKSAKDKPRLPPGFSVASVSTPAHALYPFDPASQKVPSGLELQVGDKVIVLGHQQAWYFGKNARTAASGIFPKSFVQVDEDGTSKHAEKTPKQEAKRVTKTKPSHRNVTTASEDNSRQAAHPSSPGNHSKHANRSLPYGRHAKTHDSALDDEDGLHVDASDKSLEKHSQQTTHRRRRSSASSASSSASSQLHASARPPMAKHHHHRASASAVTSTPALSEEALALIAKLREEIPVTNELTKEVFDHIRRHCSRSFALLVLQEFERRSKEQEATTKAAAAAVREEADRDIRFLLDEVDRLSAGHAPDEVEALRADNDDKARQIAAFEQKVKELQAKIAALENEEWLRNELAVLKQDGADDAADDTDA